MDEMEYRATLSMEELEKRAPIITAKIFNIEHMERLMELSVMLSKIWDELVNYSIANLFENEKLLREISEKMGGFSVLFHLVHGTSICNEKYE